MVMKALHTTVLLVSEEEKESLVNLSAEARDGLIS